MTHQTKITDPIRDLSRTEAALRKYDRISARLRADTVVALPSTRFAELWGAYERACTKLGEAFGHDTADRNKMSDCRGLVKPGYSKGAEFVRRAVQCWRERVL